MATIAEVKAKARAKKRKKERRKKERMQTLSELICLATMIFAAIFGLALIFNIPQIIASIILSML